MENPSSLSREELMRYSRHLLIPEFGLKGQEKLKGSKVLVIGAGGLGSPVLLYLAAAGVGQIGIVDGDRVEHSNLQRQILFQENEVGQWKSECAANRLLKLNSHIAVQSYPIWLNKDNALEIFSTYDLIIDGSDNFPTRYLVNDACVILGKPLVYGSIYQYEGQVAVFNDLDQGGNRGPNYRDLFPVPPPPGMIPSCAEGGVLGVLPGMIGSMQANEALKILTGTGTTLHGRIFIFDALHFTSVTLKINRNQSLEPIYELVNYEVFCGIEEKKPADVGGITPTELANWLEHEPGKIHLVDVRDPHEYAIADLAGQKIPLAGIESTFDQIPRDKKVIFYCRSGNRSAQALARMRILTDREDLFHLRGGLLAYADDVDQNMSKY